MGRLSFSDQESFWCIEKRLTFFEDPIWEVPSSVVIYAYFLMQVPQDMLIYNRLKGFYGSRRNSSLLEEDSEKNLNRKLAVKASRITYVRCS